MASSCDFYKGSIKLGSGTCAGGSASVTSYTANDSGGASADVARVCARKNITVVVTQAGVYAGLSWRARVLTEGSTCTLSEPCPFTNA
jgi:hypothetical protein